MFTSASRRTASFRAEDTPRRAGPFGMRRGCKSTKRPLRRSVYNLSGGYGDASRPDDHPRRACCAVDAGYGRTTFAGSAATRAGRPPPCPIRLPAEGYQAEPGRRNRWEPTKSEGESPERFSPLAGGLGAVPPVIKGRAGWGSKTSALSGLRQPERISRSLNTYDVYIFLYTSPGAGYNLTENEQHAPAAARRPRRRRGFNWPYYPSSSTLIPSCAEGPRGYA